jgi:hypothetical protein
MRRVRFLCALVVSLPLLALAAMPGPAQVLSPSSHTGGTYKDPIALKGYAPAPGQRVTIHAIDQNTGSLVSLPLWATAKTSGVSYATSSGRTYKLYPWTYDVPATLAANYWAPQSISTDLQSSQGHLELRALLSRQQPPISSGILGTFSPAALASLSKVLRVSHDFKKAAARFSDGDTTVLLDQSGVGNGPASPPWTNVLGAAVNPPAGSTYLPVAWSVGSYIVASPTATNGTLAVYALVCAPTTGGPYPVVIYNHGGLTGPDATGNLFGSVTSSGWTAPPPNNTTDDLGQCVDWAKRGWIFAMSAYRGGIVTLTQAPNSTFQLPTTSKWVAVSDGVPQFCLGEVTDVLALTNLVKFNGSPSAVTVGSKTNSYHINASNEMFMYGWSHGGCITYRAVEQGAPVTAFAVIEGFTDVRLTYLNFLSRGVTPANAAPSAIGPTTAFNALFYPDNNGVMGYNWRSGHYFAARGDLKIQKFRTMPIVIFHGDADPGNPATPTVINPVFLNEPIALSADIGATNIFVGPNSSAPTGRPCIPSALAVGAPVADPVSHEPLSGAALVSCLVSFTSVNQTDPCVNGDQMTLQGTQGTGCLPVPLPSVTSQPPHYLVVFHNMNHINGARAIEATLSGFVQKYFGATAGCNGVNDGADNVCNDN